MRKGSGSLRSPGAGTRRKHSLIIADTAPEKRNFTVDVVQDERYEDQRRQASADKPSHLTPRPPRVDRLFGPRPPAVQAVFQSPAPIAQREPATRPVARPGRKR